MKVFIKKVALFVFIPLIGWHLLEAFLPITIFTNRHHEAVFYKTEIPHRWKMYPNLHSSMEAVGDLCHHTNFAVIKHEIWKTDAHGFRNESFIDKADVLLIGDSFIEGTSLSQEELLHYKLNKKYNDSIKVYSMAPLSFTEFDMYLRKGIIKKPKLLIVSNVERNVPPAITKIPIKQDAWYVSLIKDFLEFENINVYLDKAFKHYSIEWFKARVRETKGSGIPAVGDPNMFFLRGINQKYIKGSLDSTFKVVMTYKKYCDSAGINFVFLPMPNKETVYYELVPFKTQPQYLFQLDALLNAASIKTINTLSIYNNYRSHNKTLLYHYDDTHWNTNGTELIADEIVKATESDLKALR